MPRAYAMSSTPGNLAVLRRTLRNYRTGLRRGWWANDKATRDIAERDIPNLAKEERRMAADLRAMALA